MREGWNQGAPCSLGVQYARACERRTAHLAQLCLDIADGRDPATLTLADGSHLMVLDPNGASKINRLRIDTRCLAQDREGLGPAMRNSPATAP